MWIWLRKAFDRVIRQLVVGWGAVPAGERLSLLLGLGVSRGAAEWITAYLDERGHLFQQWGVDPSTTDMIRTLQEKAWFRVRGGQRRITSRTGGRQGCCMGSVIFNSAYSVAIDVLRWRLAQAGLTLRVHVPHDAFWAPSAPDEECTDAVDVTFVDDECVVLVASSPSKLRAAVDILLDTILSVFGASHLQISWEPGKTEGIVRFRGPGAVAAREACRLPDGSLGISLAPVGCDETLHLVDSYKHLGTYVDHYGMHVTNVLTRVRSALSAYAPLSFKLYGSPLISVRHRLHFFRTLVVNRLTHNLHISTLTSRGLKRVNAVYMRGLRRIHGDARFTADTALRDVEVRRALGVASIDAMLLTARLRYLGRLVRQRPATLLGLLHFRSGARRLPWVDLVRRDADAIAAMHLLPPGFPAFDDDPAAWTELLRGEATWARILDKVFFVESACDAQTPVADEGAQARALNFPCACCNCAFASQKARDSHARAKHGVRSPFQARIRSAICPCCGVDFRQRVRCLNHLGDRRRPRCAQYVLLHCPLLSQADAERLNEVDRRARSDAYRAGHSRVSATSPALNARGIAIGQSSR